MLTKSPVKSPIRSPVGQKQLDESFEEKQERRLEFHETLRNRYNITSCRQDNPSWGREQEGQEQSPRQEEFLRRRHLWADACGVKRVRSPPRCQKYVRISPGKEVIGFSFLFKEPEPSPNKDLKSSWLHNPDQVNNNHNLALLQTRNNKKDISRIEKGVQTIHESPRICIKRDSSQQTDCSIAVLNGELLQLSGYLVEALQREKKLKKKLCALQELVNALMQMSEKTWRAHINEDKLKCKVAALENQLFIYSQSFPKASVKQILLEMEEKKHNYELKVKDSLQKLTEEKLAAEKLLHNAERSLVMSTDECDLWKEEYEQLKEDWKELAIKNFELKNELHVLQSKLQWVETQDSQLQQLQNRLQRLERERIELQAKNDLLQEDSERKGEQLSSFEVRLRNAETQKLELQIKLSDLQNDVLTMKQKSSNLLQDSEGLLVDHLEERTLQNDQLRTALGKLAAKEKECEELQTELESLTVDYKSSQRKLQQCREDLKGTHRQKPERRRSFWTCVFLIFAVFTIILLIVENFGH
ncbi:TRAF3-interacting JNK-activating modulator [Bombina bombina]|uniref:TRAF3-interacting JNK-activating modulator n=1 Tax=Bombina bombina TaxID=8345 RepID=UPI00235AFB86|nr:TRAF3-interacting JNK-activating modulator [Bombina bombina]